MTNGLSVSCHVSGTEAGLKHSLSSQAWYSRVPVRVRVSFPRNAASASFGALFTPAFALIAFVGGYTAGFRHDGFATQYSVPLHAAPGLAASAKIQIGKRDSHGNWPLRVEAKGLPNLKRGYYEMYLTRGKQIWTCGTFAGGGQSTVKVRLTVPYSFRGGDGWIVTKQLPGQATPGPIVLTT